MKIDTRIAHDLQGYFRCIDEITESLLENQTDETGRQLPVLWYRGQDDIHHSLVPSLYRTSTRARRSMTGDYSSLHYAEDIRTQHYIAKNNHFFQNEPSSRVEWLEVMQHHQVKTRALDWSESSIHSLMFALEAFLNDKQYDAWDRRSIAPCVWVLEPAALNKAIFENIAERVSSDEIMSLMTELNFSAEEKDILRENLKEFSKFHIYDETEMTEHLDYILNLNAINDEILRDRSRMHNLLLSGDVVNPYYYIISRIYSDGHIQKERILPPLAIVQSYHSERIKAQHGVFTIFPFNEETGVDEMCRKFGVNPDAMENNRMAGKVLHKIIIADPYKTAKELVENGMNDSWLYPELPVASSAIESRGFFG